jgi:predicted PolB exonuclease-like 3'-5' exonuclease
VTKPTRHLFLDLETIPDKDLPEAPPAEDGRVLIPSVPHHEIVVVGCLLFENYVPRAIGVSGEGKSERDTLVELFAWVEKTTPTIVTWNGRGFDMPCLAARAFKHGVPMRWYYGTKDVRYRYSTSGHMDVMDYVTDFGGTKSSKLDVYAKLCGFPGKMGTDGSKVAEMVALGEIESVRAYCLTDVAQLAAIFLRLQLVRGEIPMGHYRTYCKLFYEFLAKQPRLEELVSKIDRGSFMLDGVGEPGSEEKEGLAALLDASGASIVAPGVVLESVNAPDVMAMVVPRAG